MSDRRCRKWKETAVLAAAVFTIVGPSANVRGQLLALSEGQPQAAEANYQQYCALCHGADRSGYKNDHAPSLKSKSLLSSGLASVYNTIKYGRPDTPMGGYLDEIGGPMSSDEVRDMTLWLFEKSGAEPIQLSDAAVEGDSVTGRKIYARECAQCHGERGEGGVGTALGNPAMLAMSSDQFLRYAIAKGRDDTPMPAFEDRLSPHEIDDVTAFLRSRASRWTVETPVLQSPPSPERYVLNPDGADPELILDDDLYVSSEDLHRALKKRRRLVLFDARVMSQWNTAHIEGAVPLPYYKDADAVLSAVSALPRDVQIVAYCACPRAASVKVVSTLREEGFSKAAVLYEGFYGWISLGFPIVREKDGL